MFIIYLTECLEMLSNQISSQQNKTVEWGEKMDIEGKESLETGPMNCKTSNNKRILK
jgi:hypothetical protein